MTYDAGDVIQSVQNTRFIDRSYEQSYETVYTTKFKSWGYIAFATDLDRSEGNYYVSVPDLNNAIIKARIVLPVDRSGANGGSGAVPPLVNGQSVIIERIGRHYYICGIFHFADEKIKKAMEEGFDPTVEELPYQHQAVRHWVQNGVGYRSKLDSHYLYTGSSS